MDSGCSDKIRKSCITYSKNDRSKCGRLSQNGRDSMSVSANGDNIDLKVASALLNNGGDDNSDKTSLLNSQKTSLNTAGAGDVYAFEEAPDLDPYIAKFNRKIGSSKLLVSPQKSLKSENRSNSLQPSPLFNDGRKKKLIDKEINQKYFVEAPASLKPGWSSRASSSSSSSPSRKRDTMTMKSSPMNSLENLNKPQTPVRQTGRKQGESPSPYLSLPKRKLVFDETIASPSSIKSSPNQTPQVKRKTKTSNVKTTEEETIAWSLFDKLSEESEELLLSPKRKRTQRSSTILKTRKLLNDEDSDILKLPQDNESHIHYTNVDLNGKESDIQRKIGDMFKNLQSPEKITKKTETKDTKTEITNFNFTLPIIETNKNRTYASTRSFRSDPKEDINGATYDNKSEDDEDDEDDVIEENKIENVDFNRSLTNREDINSLQNIDDLRASGMNSKSLDELNYYIESFKDNYGFHSKRSSLLELSLKISQDKEFLKLLIKIGLPEYLIKSVLKDEKDYIILISFFYLYYKLIENDSSINKSDTRYLSDTILRDDNYQHLRYALMDLLNYEIKHESNNSFEKILIFKNIKLTKVTKFTLNEFLEEVYKDLSNSLIGNKNFLKDDISPKYFVLSFLVTLINTNESQLSLVKIIRFFQDTTLLNSILKMTDTIIDSAFLMKHGEEVFFSEKEIEWQYLYLSTLLVEFISVNPALKKKCDMVQFNQILKKLLNLVIEASTKTITDLSLQQSLIICCISSVKIGIILTTHSTPTQDPSLSELEDFGLTNNDFMCLSASLVRMVRKSLILIDSSSGEALEKNLSLFSLGFLINLIDYYDIKSFPKKI
ncbi:hypothetical protein PACTADRAFT_49672, partial [Pachysolen tannophilus NRRL Y-2460]